MSGIVNSRRSVKAGVNSLALSESEKLCKKSGLCQRFSIVDMFSLALMLLNKHPKVQEIVSEAVPSLQMNIVQQGYNESHDHSMRMILFMVIITVVSTIGGALLFKKSDLK